MAEHMVVQRTIGVVGQEGEEGRRVARWEGWPNTEVHGGCSCLTIIIVNFTVPPYSWSCFNIIP